MKFIAVRSFVHGPRKALKIPGDPHHVVKGTTLELDEELQKDRDVSSFISMGHIVQMDSDAGKQMEAEITKEKAIAAAAVPVAAPAKTNWHRVNAWIGLGILVSGILIYLFAYLLSR